VTAICLADQARSVMAAPASNKKTRSAITLRDFFIVQSNL